MAFYAELITIRGAIFGILVMNSSFISFKSQPRARQVNFLRGTTKYSHCDKTLNKKWQLGEVKELVVKRFNLEFQAAELYLSDSKSIFFNFFDVELRRKFVNHFKECMKNQDPHTLIVEDPVGYFLDKKFTMKWRHCHISNFEYLMLLNKYAGRSFNDLGQYPVFPWVLGQYKGKLPQLANPGVYRDLSKSIAGISKDKVASAKDKYDLLRSEMIPGVEPFQFGSHYLAARMVLGYLFRLEPYASRMIEFEKGQDMSARMFHIIDTTWKICNEDASFNNELIPEFFYLPEMFANYNKCSFGTKQTNEDLPKEVRGRRIRVDQVVVPGWAHDNHDFVRMNYLALESRHVSLNIHNWINLIFGYQQQLARYNNLFKSLCDSSGIKKKELDESNIAEIQEFGSNPIKVFKEEHPIRRDDSFDRRTKHTIFPNENTHSDLRYTLYCIGKFDAPITFVTGTSRFLIVILDNQRVFHSKETTLDAPGEIFPTFFPRSGTLPFPAQKMLEANHSVLACDGRRCFGILKDDFVITCRHYDNSCKVTHLGGKSVKRHMQFHKAMVSTIYVTRDGNHVLSGALDGTVAEWEIADPGRCEPTVCWYACDHEAGVVSIDGSKDLDLMASGSLDGTVVKDAHHKRSGKARPDPGVQHQRGDDLPFRPNPGGHQLRGDGRTWIQLHRGRNQMSAAKIQSAEPRGPGKPVQDPGQY